MILVTGATGFIGSALSEVLAQGRRPWIEVSRQTPPQSGTDEPRQPHGSDETSQPGGSDEPRRRGTADVTDAAALARVAGDATAIIHLAGVTPGMKPMRADHEVAAMQALLEFARGRPIERFIFLSATGAAASASHPWLREKGQAEALLMASGLPWVILRASFVFGAGSRILNALMQVVKSESKLRLPLLRGGRFLPVGEGDVAIALATALDNHLMKERVIELGAEPELTLENLVALVAQRLRRKLDLSRWPFQGMPLHDALERVAVFPLTNAESWTSLFGVFEPPRIADFDRLVPMRRTALVEDLRTYPWGMPPPRPGEPLPVLRPEQPTGLPLFIPGPRMREEGDAPLPPPARFGRVDPFGTVEPPPSDR